MGNKQEILANIRGIIRKIEAVEPLGTMDSVNYSLKLADVVSGVSDMLFIVSPDGRFLSYFGGLNNEFYIEPKEFIGKKIAEIFPKKISLAVDRKIAGALLGKRELLYYDIAGHVWEARFTKTNSGKILVVVRNLSEDVREILKVMRIDS